MSNTPSVTPVSSSRLEYRPSESRLRASAPETPAAPVPEDQVEISDQALALEADGQNIRLDLVARVRSEIAAGTYLTDDKIDQAVSGLLDDLRD